MQQFCLTLYKPIKKYGMNTVAIVGGGLSGLTSAFFFNQINIPVKIYEKKNWGGSVGSQKMHDVLLENTADVFYLDNPLLHHVCEHLNLSSKLLPVNKEANRVYIVKDKALYRLPETFSELWKSSLLFFIQKIKIYFALKKIYSFWPNMTMYDAAKNIFGESFAEVFASGFSRLNFSIEAEDIEIASAFEEVYNQLPSGKGNLREALNKSFEDKKKLWSNVIDQEVYASFEAGYYRIEGGLQVLVSALKENILQNPINQDPLVNDQVLHFNWQNEKIHIKTAKGKSHIVDKIVLTTNPQQNAKMTKNLNEEVSELFSQIKTTSHSRITCAWDKKEFHPSGYGITIPRQEKLSVHNELHLSNVCPERVPDNLFVTRTIISGDNRLMDDSQLVAICSDLRKKVHGSNLQPAWFFVEHKDMQPWYAPGHYQIIQKLKQNLQNIPVAFLGKYYTAYDISHLLSASFSLSRKSF